MAKRRRTTRSRSAYRPRRVRRRAGGRPTLGGWVLGLGALLALALGAYGVYQAARWHHQRQIDASLESFRPIIEKYAARYNVPRGLMRSVIRAESGGDTQAVSSSGARGLMQIMPATKDEIRTRASIGEGDLFDPDYNVRLGAAYLRILLDRFGGDVRLTVAAYHMGPTRVQQLRDQYPDMPSDRLVETFAGPATREYVRIVLAGITAN